MTLTNAGNVGIGTTNPLYKTQINVAGNGETALAFMNSSVTSDGGGSTNIRFVSATNAQWANASFSAYSYSFFGNGSEKFTILGSSGNVGIGVTSPASKLDINGGRIGIRNNIVAPSNLTYSTIYSTENTGAAYPFTGTSGNLVVEPRNGQDFVVLGSSGVAKMVVKGAGNVGIGTTSPSATLDLGINGGQKFYVYANGTIRSGMGIDLSGSSRELSIFHTSSNNIDGDISFGLRNETSGQYVERMRVQGNGNVGINSTNPGQKLAIEGSGSADENVLRVNNQANVSSRIWLRNSGQSAYIFNSGSTPDTIASGVLGQAFGLGINNNSPIQFFSGLTASVKMTILSSGNVGIGRTQADEKLEVEGNIKAKDIDGKIFSMVASWSYVASKNDLFSYPGTDGAVWEYTIKMNPNTAGSGSYRDYYYGKIGIGIGWNGSNVTQYIWQQQDQTAPRSLYDSGGGNFNPLFRMYYSGGVYTQLPINTAWTLRIQGLSTTTFGDIFFRRLA